MKKYMVLLSLIFLFSCMSTPKSTIVSAENTDFNALNDKIQVLLAGKKMDSAIEVGRIPDADLRSSLEKINIRYLRVVNKTEYNFGDSVIIYSQKNPHISIRLYRWEKITEIVYDLSVNKRDLGVGTGATKIKERVYIVTSKVPGAR